MQWVRAACVRPAPSMRVCARSYLGRASIAKTVVDILQQLRIQIPLEYQANAARLADARAARQLERAVAGRAAPPAPDGRSPAPAGGGADARAQGCSSEVPTVRRRPRSAEAREPEDADEAGALDARARGAAHHHRDHPRAALLRQPLAAHPLAARRPDARRAHGRRGAVRAELPDGDRPALLDPGGQRLPGALRAAGADLLRALPGGFRGQVAPRADDARRAGPALLPLGARMHPRLREE
eukprot:scaffold5844_cov56-Phaeocystis_antarctica.AAC.2